MWQRCYFLGEKVRGGAWDPFEALFLAFLSTLALVVCPLEEAGAVSASLSESQAQL